MELADRIQPAIRLNDGKPLSDEEFQKLLYDYFEEQGIMLELRAHLRTQMIKVLKDTSLGKSLINKPKDMSPKIQALNLLIAEYLLQKEYHYSLSVFSTEVPLSSTFPNCSTDFTSKEQIAKFRFSENDMWDILETLGFMQTSEMAQKVCVSYRESNTNALLNCIIRNINEKLNDEKGMVLAKLRDSSSKDIEIETFVVMLKEAGIDSQIILKIIEHIKCLLSNELKKIEECKEEEYAVIKARHEFQSNKKVERFQRKLKVLEKVFDDEKRRLEHELEETKTNLKECAKSLQAKYKDINKLDEELHKRHDFVVLKEQQLEEKERLVLSTLDEIVKQKKSFELLNGTKKQSANKEQQTIEDIYKEKVLLQGKIKEMETQICDLRVENEGYLQRIQEFAVRTNALMKELEETRNLGTRDVHGVHRSTNLFSTHYHAVPSLPSLALRTSYGIGSYKGAGEDGQNCVAMRSRKAKILPSDASQHPGSSSDELSATEVILQEAKARLQSLEMESAQIDQHYADYKTRSANTNLIQDFQANVASIKDSISRLFMSRTPSLLRRPEPTSSALNLLNSERMRNLNVDLPAPADNKESFDDVIQSLRMLHDNPSANSSGILIGTSISTLEISSDNHNSDAEMVKNGDISTENGLWNHVGLPCLLVFIIELLLFR